MPLNPHNFHPNQIAAGYDQKQWKIPAKDSALVGTYSLPVSGDMKVSWLEKGPAGQPELLLDFTNGPKMTVLDEETAMEYIRLHGAVKSSQS